jgi:hypothetical protein
LEFSAFLKREARKKLETTNAKFETNPRDPLRPEVLRPRIYVDDRGGALAVVAH